MRLPLVVRLACVSLVVLLGRGGLASPLVFNMSMDGSGEGELELLFPAVFSTRAPVPVTATTPVPSLTNTITTTMIRLKDFVLSRLVDFLQENLLIIIVVTSLLIVMVFIICCASAMSHKRKLEAYKAPANPPRKYTDNKSSGVKPSSELQDRPYVVDHVKRLQAETPKNLRTPSKALVGEKEGKDLKPKHQEVQKVREAEEEVTRREEPKQKEEVQQSSNSNQPMVCTCHLRKAHQ